MEIASWQALDEKWHWPSNVYLPQLSERPPFSDGKTKNPTLYWEQPKTLGVGLVQLPLWEDQIYLSYFEMILTPDYKWRLLWSVPKARLRCFRLPFVSTGCGTASFLNKSDMPSWVQALHIEMDHCWPRQHD